MSQRNWTIVLAPDGSRSRAVRVSVHAFRLAVSAAAVCTLAAAAAGYHVVTRAVDLSRLDRLQKRNQLLAEELQATAEVVRTLQDTLATLSERDRQVRLLAGLSPTDPEVLLAGVGGPAGSWTEREQILSEGPVGRRALEVRRAIDELVRRANLLATSYGQAVDSLANHRERLQRTPSIAPILPGVGFFSSHFAEARLHPIFHEARPHEGVDVSAPLGTEILAPASGRVVDVRTSPGYGKTVTIDHGYGVLTRYAHCSKIVVRVGQWVKRAEKIAEVGNTGIATAPHLHYEVLVNGRPVDPRTFMFSLVVD